jgi:hypothetical protein
MLLELESSEDVETAIMSLPCAVQQMEVEVGEDDGSNTSDGDNDSAITPNYLFPL